MVDDCLRRSDCGGGVVEWGSEEVCVAFCRRLRLGRTNSGDLLGGDGAVGRGLCRTFMCVIGVTIAVIFYFTFIATSDVVLKGSGDVIKMIILLYIVMFHGTSLKVRAKRSA